MTQGDTLGLILSYVYAFGLLFAVEALGRRRAWPRYLTRKLIHIGAGMWVWGILALFDTWYLGLIPFGTFIGLNYLFYRAQAFKAMDAVDSSPGTVYFAISITALFALLWRTDGSGDRVALATAAVMAMTWGDGVASIVGQRYGARTYTTFGHTRSWEGTLAMAACSFLGILLTLRWLPGSGLSPHSAPYAPAPLALMTLGGTLVATTAESLSPAGTDNLSVPLLTALALLTLHGLVGG